MVTYYLVYNPTKDQKQPSYEPPSASSCLVMVLTRHARNH